MAALHHASYNGHPKLAALLLAQRAALEAVDEVSSCY